MLTSIPEDESHRSFVGRDALVLVHRRVDLLSSLRTPTGVRSADELIDARSPRRFSNVLLKECADETSGVFASCTTLASAFLKTEGLRCQNSSSDFLLVADMRAS